MAPEHCMYHLGFWGPQAQGLRACAQPLRPPPPSLTSPCGPGLFWPGRGGSSQRGASRPHAWPLPPQEQGACSCCVMPRDHSGWRCGWRRRRTSMQVAVRAVQQGGSCALMGLLCPFFRAPSPASMRQGAGVCRGAWPWGGAGLRCHRGLRQGGGCLGSTASSQSRRLHAHKSHTAFHSSTTSFAGGTAACAVAVGPGLTTH